MMINIIIIYAHNKSFYENIGETLKQKDRNNYEFSYKISFTFYSII